MNANWLSLFKVSNPHSALRGRTWRAVQGTALLCIYHLLITKYLSFPASSQKSPDFTLSLFGQNCVKKPLQPTSLAHLVWDWESLFKTWTRLGFCKKSEKKGSIGWAATMSAQHAKKRDEESSLEAGIIQREEHFPEVTVSYYWRTY